VTDPTLLDETHDPHARSWLASANEVGCEFPIQNLPFAVFRRGGSTEEFRGGVAIGDQIVDLAGEYSSRRPPKGFRPAAALRSTH
jgi:fumarylacetoacetase